MQDSVDVIQAELSALHPGINTETAAIVGRIMRLSRIMQTVTDRALAERNVSRAEFDIISVLIRTGRPMSATELARSLWTSGAGTTKRLSKLMSSGLITKETNPADARSVLVSPTEAAREAFAPALTALAAVESRMLAPVGAKTRRRLATDLRELLLVMEDSESAARTTGG